VLHDRRKERAVIDRLLGAAVIGQSGALVARGEAGAGKSALMGYADGAATTFRVARACGVESELELAFAGLHQLCAPFLGGLDRLPPPQRDAIETAFAISRGSPPDRFVIGLAVLGLLADAAQERPLLCVIDDLQWLDAVSAQALAFVARRLRSESVVLLFATRNAREPDELSGLPELRVEGLPDADARKLLAAAIPGQLDQRVVDRIVAETRGNPLALLELPRELSLVDLAGGFGLPNTLPLSGQIEESFRRRVERLPSQTQRLLLLAAAEPTGDAALLWRASALLGIGVGASAPAEADDLVEVGADVRFRHPLVRSALYRAASQEERRGAHRALAEATDPQVDPDRRAWHRAQAALEPDEGVAAELERSAGRARTRGGLAAAAAFLERSAALTVEPARRGERALAAAQAKQQAGAPDAALRLLAVAEQGPLDELQRAHVGLLRAQIAFVVHHGGDAPALLLQAVKQMEPLDARLARDTYLEALAAAQFAGRLARGSGVHEAANAALAAPPAPKPPRATDLLLDGLAVLLAEGYAHGAPILKGALQAFRSKDISDDEALRWTWLACRVAIDMWDYDTWDVLSIRLVELTRDAGALAALPLALTLRMGLHLYAGELGAVASLNAEVDAVTEATASQLAPYGALLLAAWQGREAEASEVIEATIAEVVPRGEALGLTAARWATAVLYNGLGRYQEALAAAMQASDREEDLGFSNWSLAELVEAAVRSGETAAGADALERLTRSTRPCGTDWALGIEARSRALLSEGGSAEIQYREAIDRLGRAGVRVELARARLLYGEWLRREHRRLDAREQLRIAHDMFTEWGIEAFADRAARELLATGETARKRSLETWGELTAQESQIARLARDGLSNPDIGGRLFISPRTVEYHLHKVFSKLRISSRNELGQVQLGQVREAQTG
jgi:DNA-binding CsgD family transcriptional regulator